MTEPAKHSWKKVLLINVLLVLGMLVGGELGLRVWAYYFRLPYQRLDRQSGIIRLVPGYRESIEGKLLQINSSGFRGPEVTPPKPSGVYRIVMLGDSVTFGLPGEDCHYPGVLQSIFDSESSGRVEVINAGVEGYNSQDALRLMSDVAAYSPDLVTIMIGWNDLIKQDPARPGVTALQARLAYDLYDVYLIKLWRRLIYFDLRRALLTPGTELASQEEESFMDYIPMIYRKNLLEIVSTAKGGGSDVVLLTLPSLLRENMTPQDVSKLYFPHYTYNLRKFVLLHERYNETIRGVGRETGTPVVELQKPLEGRESELFMDTAHLECGGYQILGRYLYEALSPRIARATGMIAARNH